MTHFYLSSSPFCPLFCPVSAHFPRFLLIFCPPSARISEFLLALSPEPRCKTGLIRHFASEVIGMSNSQEGYCSSLKVSVQSTHHQFMFSSSLASSSLVLISLRLTFHLCRKFSTFITSFGFHPLSFHLRLHPTFASHVCISRLSLSFAPRFVSLVSIIACCVSRWSPHIFSSHLAASSFIRGLR